MKLPSAYFVALAVMNQPALVHGYDYCNGYVAECINYGSSSCPSSFDTSYSSGGDKWCCEIVSIVLIKELINDFNLDLVSQHTCAVE